MESDSFGFVVGYSMFLMQYLWNWLKLAFTRNNEDWPYILSHSGRFVREKSSTMQCYYLLMQHKLSISKLQIHRLQN
jgi:transketolase C-terminal domain/subunit